MKHIGDLSEYAEDGAMTQESSKLIAASIRKNQNNKHFLQYDKNRDNSRTTMLEQNQSSL
jgi:hypothetical protein